MLGLAFGIMRLFDLDNIDLVVVMCGRQYYRRHRTQGCNAQGKSQG